VLKGLEVDVGGLVADGLGEHQIHEADDGSLAGQCLEVIRVKIFGALGGVAALLEVGEKIIEVGLLLGVVVLEQGVDTHRIANDDAHVLAEGEGEIVHDLSVERISGEQVYGLGLDPIGDHAVSAGLGDADACDDIPGDGARHIGEVFGGEVVGHCVQERGFGDQVHLQRQGGDGFTGEAVLFLHRGQGGLVEAEAVS